MKIGSGKVFTPSGLIVISLLLLSGIAFAYIYRIGIINRYFNEKNPPIKFSKMPPARLYKIGFVTDAHSRVTKYGYVRPESENPMQSFVSEMNNNFQPFFAIDGGDFIDGTRRFGEKSIQDYTHFSKIFKTVKTLTYQVLGNHDLRGMTREDWIKINNYKNSYYYFDYEKLRVIIFDSTLLPGSENSAKVEDYTKQLAWLKETLENSKGYKKIIFTHYPYVPLLKKTMPIERIEEFNKLVSDYGVRAVFSGHVEVPYYEKIGKVDYFVVPGFFRSKATGMSWYGSFAEIKIGRRNSLKFFYKKNITDTEYQTLTIPSPNYDIVKKEIMNTVNFLAPVE